MRQIITGLASYGMSGSLFHAPFISINSGFDLKFIVERSKNNAKERYPNVNILRSYKELIEEPEVELVVVNTPDVTHYEYTKMALLAGKHVVVEKPFVFNIDEGNELIELAKDKSLLLCVYQNRRWDGDFLTIRKILESDHLGRVVEFYSSYQRYRNYIQLNTWKEVADNRVGITYNLGSHMIDQVVVLFGMPDAIYADIDRLRDGSMVDDYYNIQLIYPKLKAYVKASYLVREETPRYIINGTEGSFVKHGIDPQEEMLKAGCSPSIPEWGKENESFWGTINTNISGSHFYGKIETVNGNYGLFYDEIYDALCNGKSPSTAASDVISVIKILDAAFKSVNEKKVIFLNN